MLYSIASFGLLVGFMSRNTNCFFNFQIWVYGDSKQAMLVAVVVPHEVNTEKWAELEGHKGSFTDLCKLDVLRDYVLQNLKVTAENNKVF